MNILDLITDAFLRVRAGGHKKVEVETNNGTTVKAYRVGSDLIRVDVQEKEDKPPF